MHLPLLTCHAPFTGASSLKLYARCFAASAAVSRHRIQQQDRPNMFASLFRCNFCREDLKRTRTNPVTCLTMVFGIRRYRCPHCFAPYWRPCGLLRMLMCPVETYKSCCKPSESSEQPGRIVPSDQTASIQKSDSNA